MRSDIKASNIKAPRIAVSTTKPWKRRLLCCGLLGALVLGSCRPDPLARCRQLHAEERFAEAAVYCEAAYEAHDVPMAGRLAAEARHALGEDEAALAWGDRLRGSEQEDELWTLAATIHRARGEGEEALAADHRALTLQRAAGAHAAAATTAYRLFYYTVAEAAHRQALDYVLIAVAEAAAAGDRALQSRAAQGLYAVLYTLGDLDGALRALDAARTYIPPDAAMDQARLLATRSSIYLDQGRAALARDALHKALDHAGGGGDDPLFFRSAHLNLVQANLALDRLDEAEQNLAAAAAYADADAEGTAAAALAYWQGRLAHARGRFAEAMAIYDEALARDASPEWVWDLELHRGRAAEAAGDLEIALQAYRHAADVLQTMRAALGIDELKAWHLDHQRQPFEALFRLYAAQGDGARALTVVEEVKARTFLDAFIRATSDQQPTDQASLARGALARVEALGDLLPALRASAVVSPQPLAVLLPALADRHLLVYFDAGEELWLLAVDGGRIRPRRLASTASELEATVDRFLGAPDDRTVAASLGALLLPPDLLPTPGTPLVIVPDAALGRLPFAALRTEDRPLIEDYTISYAPSLNGLVALARRQVAAPGPPAVLGDPRGDLPQAAVEAREVAILLRTAAHTGGQADRQTLEAATHAQVLHLATHTGLGARGPWLALADGEVPADAIVTDAIGPPLVVLASCASAARTGKGLWGSLAAAFLTAGSRAVVASLWSIEDATAREFVLRFYRQGGVDDPAGALARAQRELYEAGAPPAVWAPYVLFGLDRPRSSRPAGQKGD